MFDRFKEWLEDYKRYYIRGYDLIIAVLVVLVLALFCTWAGYQSGWEDSYQLFDKLRPQRPLIG